MTETAIPSAAQTVTASPLGLIQIAVPARDLTESKRFYAEVLGGEVTSEEPFKVRIGDLTIAVGEQATGATAPTAEYPHYGFTVPADDFMPLKERLEAYGIPTHEPWTRAHAVCALMYFRDPSGNQWEMYCPSGFTGIPLRIGSRAGGDYVIPFTSLVYDRVGNSPTAVPTVSPAGFNHMTVPVRDHEEGKRFFMSVFGGKLTNDNTDHKTVQVGRSSIGMAPFPSGWTARDALYPHYTLEVRGEDMLQLKRQLEDFGIPTHDVFTRDETDASLFFRDPSGNLWELYAPKGFSGPIRRALSAGGDYVLDVGALSYDAWKDPGRS